MASNQKFSDEYIKQIKLPFFRSIAIDYINNFEEVAMSEHNIQILVDAICNAYLDIPQSDFFFNQAKDLILEPLYRNDYDRYGINPNTYF